MGTLFENTLGAQRLREKAHDQARAALKRKGIEYPLYDSKLSVLENYDRLTAYSRQEADLVMSIIKEPSGPRLIIEPGKRPDPTKPLYERYKDD